MPTLEFTISIEIPDSDDLTHEEIDTEEEAYNKMLADMEKVVGEADYTIDNAEWNYL